MSQIFFGPKTMTIRVKPYTESLTLMLLAFSCIILGNFYIPISNGFFGIDVSKFTINLESLYDYIAALTIGLSFYKLVIEKDGKVVQAIRNYKVSFEAANYLFMVYIATLIVYFIFI
jgi:multicomponent Na+:H+ antiporter subunit D